ncbi:MAG TPA: ABC transporter substrate-binding protein [Caulobacteraceae bacterium]|jgi:phospholipid transport system substrate-binding protein|nr:ABC transporter substrate-binding protein [Caulobacteraceae bacterium]
MSQTFRISRRAGLALAIAASWVLTIPGAALAQGARDPGAEQYIQVQGQRVLTLLSDRSLNWPDKLRAFRSVVDQIADVPRITRFVLGKYARTATPAQREQFDTLFRAYAQNVYADRLNNYHGEIIKVIGSVARNPGDVIVDSAVSGGKLDHPEHVGWRVLNSGGGWKIVDVEVSGVWLAITQQQDFVSTIDNAHGDVGVLIAQLQNDVKRHESVRQ